MPYPNEHSATINEPSKYNKFRRENNKLGDGIHVIWGIPNDGPVEIQAIRFEADKFTAEAAKTWCKDNGHKYISFEPASGVSNKSIRPIARHRGSSWYSISAKDMGPVEVFIYDEIGGFGISATDFVKDLRMHKGKDVSLRLNTPGGDVFGGQIIYNALKEHGGKVTTYIDGVAASIGSVIALAGDTVKMADNAFFMIHNPFAILAGDADELRKKANLLDKIKGTMANTYADKSGKDLDTINTWMNDETWFTAVEAKDAGFCDEISGEAKVAACFDLSIYAHTPQKLMSEFELMATFVPPKPKDARELEHALRDVGFSRSESRAIVARGYKGIGQCDADAVAKIAAYEIINLFRASA